MSKPGLLWVTEILCLSEQTLQVWGPGFLKVAQAGAVTLSLLHLNSNSNLKPLCSWGQGQNILVQLWDAQ